MSDASRGRRRPLATVVLTALALILLVPAHPAAAGPTGPVTRGSEGSTPTLGQVLEDVNRAYLDAQAAFERSRQRQQELAQQVAKVEHELAALLPTTRTIALTAYRTG